MVKADIYDDLLNEINRQLENIGVIIKRGAIVDAGITDSPRRPRGRKEYVAVEDRNEEENNEASEQAMLKEKEKPNVDRDARWVKKMGKLRFGYKRNTVTGESGLIIAEETTAANESDTKHFEEPLRKANLPKHTPVYADKGYDSKANREVLEKYESENCIMHKGAKGKGLSAYEKSRNAVISKTRYRVGRTFGSIHRWFRGGIARYVGLAKIHGQHIMEAIACNLYRSPGIIVSKCIG